MNGRVEAANLLRAIRAVGAQRGGDLLDWALTMLPDSLVVQRLHVQSLLSIGDIAGAEAAVARALLQRPGNVSLAQLRVECLVQRSRWLAAEDEIQAVLERRPHHRRARELAAHIAIERGRYDRALALLDARPLASDDRSRALLVTALLGVSNRSDAAAAERTAHIDRAELLVAAMHEPPATLSAAVLTAQGRMLDAADVLEAASDRECDNLDDVLCMLLGILEKTGSAERLHRTMQRITSSQPKARTLIGSILLSQGRFRAAALVAAEMARTAHRSEALPTLIVAASMLGRSRLARRAMARLRRTGSGIDVRIMAERWQRGMFGKLLRAQHDARQAGCDPESSVLQALLEDARQRERPLLKKSRRIDDSAGGVAQLSERKNVLVSSPVDC